MKKRIIKGIFITIGIIFFTAYGYSKIGQPVLKRTNEKNQSNLSAQIRENSDTTLTNWKTCTNKKLGFTFQYPNTWVQNGKEADVIDLSGVVTVIEIDFNDTESHTTLSLQYHLAPNGPELYRYAVSQFDSSQGLYATGGKQIKVAGNTAIQANTIYTMDGKGNALNPPLSLILVDFLDKQQTGEIELQFNTPLPNYTIESAKFKQLLSTFTFSN